MREDLHEGSIPDKPSAPAEPSPGTSPFDELDSRPHVFDDRGHQVSLDGQHWWNGGMWVPGQPPGSEPFPAAGNRSPSGGPALTAVQAVIAIGGLILFAGFAFSVCQSMQAGSAFPAP